MGARGVGCRASGRDRARLAALDQLAEIVRRALSLGGAAFHEALEILRSVLAAEEDAALRDLLVAAEVRVLTDPPVRVRRVEEAALVRERLRRLAVVDRGEARKDGGDLREDVRDVRADAGAPDRRERAARGHRV